jgi:transcriptional regulator with XRE-family HTH domain
MSLGKKLSELRKKRNLTQDELARLLNIGKSTIGMYETDKRNPDLEMLKVFANFYDVSIDYLLDMPENERNVQRITEAVGDDPELLEFWNTLKERPDLQLLFKQTKDFNEKDIKQILKIIKTFEDEEGMND